MRISVRVGTANAPSKVGKEDARISATVAERVYVQLALSTAEYTSIARITWRALADFSKITHAGQMAICLPDAEDGPSPPRRSQQSRSAHES
jgi:hypothetical protein